MDTALMSNLHRNNSPWSWPLPARQATTLPAHGAPRWLRVEEGCVWATRRVAVGEAEDIWLGAGETLALPAGSEWVLEGWPQARLSLLLEAPLRSGRAAWVPPWRRLSWLRSSLLHA